MHYVPENFFLRKFIDEFYIQVFVMMNTILLNVIIEQYFVKYMIWGL